jgi:hypothetical protein
MYKLSLYVNSTIYKLYLKPQITIVILFKGIILAIYLLSAVFWARPGAPAEHGINVARLNRGRRFDCVLFSAFCAGSSGVFARKVHWIR